MFHPSRVERCSPAALGAAQIAADIATYARLGVSELIFDCRSESLAESLERMESFGPVIHHAASL